jgi:DNA-binding Lrp family transcriptional regulator
VDRLRASGAITGFSARVDPAALGWTTEAYVELFCNGSTTPEEIGAAVRRHPEVADACTVTGEADALVHIRAADIRHFEQVVERIAAEPFVQRTRSVIVLSRLVERADSIAPHIRLSAGSVCPCQKQTAMSARARFVSRPSRTAATSCRRRGR